eukprot:m51a1_g2089 hypothetical protein (218) ;mRNA; r:1522011-1522973
MADQSVIAEAPTPKTPEDYNKAVDDLLAWAKSTEALDPHWVPLSVSGVVAHEREGSNNPFVRAEVTINKPAAAITALLRSTDESEQRRLDSDLAWFKWYSVEGTPAERDIKLHHERVKLPWPVSPRDAFTINATVQEGNKTYVLSGSVNDTQRAPHDKSAVRSFVKTASILTADGDATHVVRLVLIEPRGSIPNMLVNKKKGENASRVLHLKQLLEK